MLDKARLVKQLIFALLAFGPLYIIVVPLLGLIFLNVTIPTIAGGHSDKLFFALLGIGIIIYYFIIILKCFDKYIVKDTLKKRLLVIYIGWMLLSGPIVFIFVNSMGGMSQAVVEGVAGSYLTRLPQYLFITLVVILAGHVLFVPWIFIADKIMCKIFK